MLKEIFVLGKLSNPLQLESLQVAAAQYLENIDLAQFCGLQASL